MKLEERYFVVKLSDLPRADAVVAAIHQLQHCSVQSRDRRGAKPLEGLFIEADWPEYETVLKMVSDRVDGVPPSALDGLLTEIRAELNRAIELFPQWPADPFHAVSVIGEEAGELVRAVNQTQYEPHKNDAPDDARVEAIQTAAMCLRFLLAWDHYKWLRAPQITQVTP